MTIVEQTGAIVLRADRFSLPVVEIIEPDLEAISAEVSDRVSQAPGFFASAPVVVDVSAVTAGGDLELAMLIGMLRGNGLNPIGVRGGGPDIQQVAAELDLTVFPGRVQKPSDEDDAEDAGTEGDDSEGEGSGTFEEPLDEAEESSVDEDPDPETSVEDVYEDPPRATVVHRPVRSGQRVWAPDGDLIVVSSAGAGSELMAHGNIHVYGALRGRAMAGIGGDTEARIFCQRLDAELVSVAGHYRVSENIPDRVRGVAVQIFLKGERLVIDPLQ